MKGRSAPRSWYRTHPDASFSAQRWFISLEGKAGGEGVCEGDSSKHKQARKEVSSRVRVSGKGRGSLCEGELVNSNWTYWPNNGFWFLDLGVLSQEWANGQIRDCILGANFRNVTVFTRERERGIRANLQCLRCWGLCSPPLGLLETQCFSFDLKTGFALNNSQRLNAIVELRRWLRPHGACYASIRTWIQIPATYIKSWACWWYPPTTLILGVQS